MSRSEKKINLDSYVLCIIIVIIDLGYSINEGLTVKFSCGSKIDASVA